MKLNINVYENKMQSDEEMANIFKTLGYERHLAWDMYVKWTGLKPRIDANAFYELFDNAHGDWKQMSKEIDFIPTHFDKLCQQRVQINQDSDGVYHLIWEDGTTGTNPPLVPPEAGRYKALEVAR